VSNLPKCDALSERSKNDREMIVGCEIRGAIGEARTCIAGLEAAIRNLANDFNDLGERCGAAEAALAEANATIIHHADVVNSRGVKLQQAEATIERLTWMIGHICKRASAGTCYAPMPWVSKEEMMADLDRRWTERITP